MNEPHTADNDAGVVRDYESRAVEAVAEWLAMRGGDRCFVLGNRGSVITRGAYRRQAAALLAGEPWASVVLPPEVGQP